MVNPAGMYISMLMQEIKKRQGYEVEKTKLLGDPDKADKMVASFSKALSPVKRAPKKGKFALQTEGYDFVVPSDHPMKGFGPQLRERFNTALKDTRYRGMPAAGILRGLAEQMYTAPDPETGESRHTSALRYKHMADTSLFQIGDDKRLTKPPMYDAYRTAVQEEFKKSAAEEPWFASPRDIATTAGAFGAITAIPTSFTGPVSGVAGFVTGAATGALVETLAHPLRRAARGTEWAQARMHSDDWVDKAKVMAVELGIELPLLVRGEKIAQRLFTVPKMAMEEMVARPTAANILKWGTVKEAAAKGASSKEVMELMAANVRTKYELGLGVESFREALSVLRKGATPLPGTAADPRRILFKELAAGEAGELAARGARTMGPTPEVEAMKVAARRAPSETTHEAVYKAFSGLDDIGLEEALGHPGGVMKGTLHAADRQTARQVVTGDIPIERAEKIAGLRANRAARAQKKASVDVVKSLDEQITKQDAWIEEQIKKFPEKEAELRARGEELRAKTLEVKAQTEKALGYEVTAPSKEFQKKNLAQLTKKREGLRKEMESIVTLQAPHREGQMVTLADRAKRGALQRELEEVNHHIRSIELELNPTSNAVIEAGTEVSAAELDHGLARIPLTDSQQEALEVASHALRQGEGGILKTDKKAAQKLLGRRVTYEKTKGAEKVLTSESKKVQAKISKAYEIDPGKAPASIGKEMEGLTEQEAYDSIDILMEKMWTKYFPDRPYTEVPTTTVAEIAEGPLTVRMTGEEAITRYADTSELFARMSAKENAAMDAAVEAWHKKALEAGTVSPGERVPGITSLEHYQRIGKKKDLFTEHAGWRPVPPGQKEADAANALGGKYLPVTKEDTRLLVKEIGRRHSAGEIGNEEALHMMTQLDEAIAGSRNISQVDKLLLREGIVTGKDFTGPVASLPTSTGVIISQLKKRIALGSFFAALGLSPLLFEMLAPQEAEAATGLFRAAGRGVKLAAEAVRAETLLKQLADAGHIVPKITDPNKKILLAGEFMKGLPGEQVTQRILRNIGGWTKDTKKGVRHIFMSPYQKAEEALQIGKYIMNNPAVLRASYQSAEYVNRTNMEQVLANIFRESGIEANPREVASRFRELVPLMKDQVSYEFHAQQVNELTKKLTKVGKDKGKKVTKEMLAIDKAILEEEIAVSRAVVEKLEGAVPTYHKRWDEIAERAAREMPSVRVYLSVWDGPTFKKAPWMKNISLTPDEQVLAGRIRNQLLEYKTRLDKAGVDTIDGPYMPVTMHPEFRAIFKDMTKDAGENTAAYTRFYRRSEGSRPLMPASETSMLYYIGDTERRLQNNLFWDSGWTEVEKRTTHLPLIQSVFKDLRDGIKPIDMTPGNLMANWYVQFEAMKRLWLNPSAGGKHLMKMTGTMAMAGFKESFKQIPKSARHLGKRALDLTQRNRGILADAGVKGVRRQEKVIDSFLHSMIPARNARHRLIDMGIHADEEIFATWRNTWHKGQNVGASWINMAEVVDRGVSALAGMEMAAKRGMTAEQAYYGAWDLLIKNNFLSRELNPAWMRDPKIRAMLMFQGTPYKIFERRLVTAIRSGRAIRRMTKSVYDATKTPEGRVELLNSIRTLRGSMKATEQELKVNLIADALKSETDFFGTPVVNQLAKDLLTIGALTMGGANIGMNLKHHIFHLPFLSGMTYDPTVAFSPGILAAWRAHAAHQKREAGDDEWLMTKTLKKWLGPTWIAPDIIWKGKRITEGDIPEMYRDSKFQYLFAIPYKEKRL